MTEEQPYYITKDRLEQMKKELHELKTVKRHEVASQIQEALEMGDLSENAAYIDAKEEQAFLEGRIIDLERMIANAQIITEEHAGKVKEVRIGSKVKVKNDREHEFTIVGSDEADPSAGRISNESPLGQAFLGKKINEVIEIKVPKGTMKYKIISIE